MIFLNVKNFLNIFKDIIISKHYLIKIYQLYFINEEYLQLSPFLGVCLILIIRKHLPHTPEIGGRSKI